MAIRRAVSTITKDQVRRLNDVEAHGLPRKREPYSDLIETCLWMGHTQGCKVTPLGLKARKDYYDERYHQRYA
jgi:hypothetical protein